MFEIFSSLLKYIFISVIYLFIFAIIRMIYLDIYSMNARRSGQNLPYIKLINRRDSLEMKVEESYILDNNLTIGRAMGNRITIADPFLSGQHAVFDISDGSCSLKDLGSTNGTFVNGKKLENAPVVLNDGDRIRIGQLDFIYVAGLEVQK
ncbi:MAG: FHA domain-containing protein [Clostridiaceae bacterium]|nr:FHA domain-containing protein [Clostridiaceae bacterium]